MGIFVIFNASDPEALKHKIASAYPADWLELTTGQYLVAAKATAKDVSDLLQITEGDTGSAIVFSMGNYFGRSSSNIWDWIKTKAEQTNG